MVKIYCLEDINDFKYIGSTIMDLNKRLNAHRSNKDCSSRNLNLDNCIIYELEECEECVRKEREQYWINKTDCVNLYKTTKFNKKEWLVKNKEKHNEQSRNSMRKWRAKMSPIEYRLFRDKINKRRKEVRLNLKNKNIS
tara:strand:- start:151 stop:567 length:417 start_codon:yes stop_codon:yes gene_type:complete